MDFAETEPDAERGRGGGQETDVWYGSLAARALLPSMALWLPLTGAAGAGLGYALAETFATATVLFGIGLIWAVLGLRWAYLFFGYNYRLTSRRLMLEMGVLHRRLWQVDLREPTTTRIEQTLLQRKLGVGRVIATSGVMTLILEGVHEPARVARLIDETGHRAREGLTAES